MAHQVSTVQTLPLHFSNQAVIQPNVALELPGQLFCNGIHQNSDRRIKKDIEAITDDECLQKVNQLNVVKYNYTIPGSTNQNKVIGFIAQEVRAVLPEAVDVTQKRMPWEHAFQVTKKEMNPVTYEYIIDKEEHRYYILDTVVRDHTGKIRFTKKERVLTDVDTGIQYDMDQDDTYVTKNQIKCYHYTVTVPTMEALASGYRLMCGVGSYECMATVTHQTDTESTLELETVDEWVDDVVQMKEVILHDFHILSKDKIFTLCVGAIQELSKEHSAIKAQLTALTARLDALAPVPVVTDPVVTNPSS